MTKRKRGAPRGNRNALKHGFYSAAFQQHERLLLTRLAPADLSNEVDLIRIANYRLLQSLRDAPAPLDVDMQLAILRAVTLSTHSINSLLRTEALMRVVNDAQPPSLNAGAPPEAAPLAPGDSACLPLPSSAMDSDDDLPPSS